MPVISSATSERSARFAAQQRHDAFDRDFDIRRRALFAGVGIELIQPAPGFDLARLRQLHANDAGGPHAMPQRPIIVSKMLYPRPAIRHQPRKDHSTVINGCIWNFRQG